MNVSRGWLTFGIYVLYCDSSSSRGAVTNAFVSTTTTIHKPTISFIPTFTFTARKKITYTAIQSYKNSKSNDSRSGSPPVEVMAVLVSIFFVIVVTLLGDQLFATPSTTSAVIIDADAMLRNDFRQVSSSVEF
mmetsp:Transcript_7920/g.11471  ORF Transcript_7920/g.11471 Transcript_7920/m.11471 type:complete len:133 (+) Transcript_7920:100-498(+)